jgi:hypothetical protein
LIIVDFNGCAFSGSDRYFGWGTWSFSLILLAACSENGTSKSSYSKQRTNSLHNNVFK